MHGISGRKSATFVLRQCVGPYSGPVLAVLAPFPRPLSPGHDPPKAFRPLQMVAMSTGDYRQLVGWLVAKTGSTFVATTALLPIIERLVPGRLQVWTVGAPLTA